MVAVTIKKMLIANRGEIALRVMRACYEMGLETVAVYSKADENSLHRRFADSSICIGEGDPSDSYLNISRIIAAAEISQADAIHPGYGFLSERADFAAACKLSNILFIGPSSGIIERMGDKAKARETVQALKIATIPGTKVLASKEAAVTAAKKIGYPVMLKAVAGGGGRGMRLVRNEQGMFSAFEMASTEARKSFSNGDMYLEKFIGKARHIEVQILADKFGNCVHLGERDCSIQRRRQKLLEETPSLFIRPKVREKICAAAIKIGKQIKYFGPGTVEFLVDEKQNFYFMEMNTRIQVEHTISELYTGIDIVKEQINLCCGHELRYKQNKIIFRGHVLECRLNAEDVANNFMPTAGEIGRFHVPQGLGVRVDTHIYSGYEVPPNYDSMLAKLIVWGLNRDEAINRMSRSLKELVIEGIPTTKLFHLQLIESKEFRQGNFHINFLENFQFQEPK